MKSIVYLLLLVTGWQGSIFAQNEPNTSTVEDYVTTAEVGAMMQELKTLMNQEFKNYIDNFLTMQGSSDEENISDEKGIRILREKAAYLLKKHDSITYQLQQKLLNGDYQYILYNNGDNQILKEEEEQKINEDYTWTFTETPPDIPKNRNQFSLNIITAAGWHNWQKSSENIPDIRAWRSGFFEIGVLSRYRLSKSNRNSPYYASLAATIITNSIRFAGNSYLKNTPEPVFELSPQNLERNSFDRTNMVFSAGFAYISSKKNGFLCEVQGFAALKLQSHTTQRFVAENSTNIINTYGRYGLNPLSVGISAAIGIKTVSLYGRYDVTALFKNQVFNGIYPYSIGLRFF